MNNRAKFQTSRMRKVTKFSTIKSREGKDKAEFPYESAEKCAPAKTKKKRISRGVQCKTLQVHKKRQSFFNWFRDKRNKDDNASLRCKQRNQISIEMTWNPERKKLPSAKEFTNKAGKDSITLTRNNLSEATETTNNPHNKQTGNVWKERLLNERVNYDSTMPVQVLLREVYKNNEKEVVVVESEGRLSIDKREPNELCSKTLFAPVLSIAKDMVLPEGFPDSVHPDYMPYQIWDAVQALASTVMGILSTHSIMKGIGVGESTATPLAAAVTWVLKDGTGMIGRIIFTWWNGTSLDTQCKKWRFFADVLNDLAMGAELLVSYFSSYSMLILCASTAMKSVVGVAGGATRAAVVQHQALRNNVADVLAKDGSQETCVNLIGSCLGIFILSLFHGQNHLWELYLILVGIHLYANYSAVKALCFNSLNEDRLALIIKSYLSSEAISDPVEVNKEESVLLYRAPGKDVCGFDIKIGASFANIIKKSIISCNEAKYILRHFQQKKYLIVINVKQRKIYIILSKEADNTDILRAYFHSCLCGLYVCIVLKLPTELLLRKSSCDNVPHPLRRIYMLTKKYTHSDDSDDMSLTVDSVCETDSIIFGEYELFLSGLEKKGWSLDKILLPVDAWRLSWKNGKCME